MTNFLMIAVASVMTLLGLVLFSRATDGMFAWAAIVLTLFGILFVFGTIRRMTE